MAEVEMTTSSIPLAAVPAASASGHYARPLAVVTTLFFMWGFLTSLNDILVPHLKSIFDKTRVRTRGELVGQVFLEHYISRWEDFAQPPPGWIGKELAALRGDKTES